MFNGIDTTVWSWCDMWHSTVVLFGRFAAEPSHKLCIRGMPSLRFECHEPLTLEREATITIFSALQTSNFNMIINDGTSDMFATILGNASWHENSAIVCSNRWRLVCIRCVRYMHTAIGQPNNTDVSEYCSLVIVKSSPMKRQYKLNLRKTRVCRFNVNL